MRQNTQHSSQPWNPDEKIVVLWSTMYGLDGTNGINGTVKKLSTRVSATEAWQTQFDTIARLVWWLVLAVVSLSGFLLSDPATKLLAKIVAP